MKPQIVRNVAHNSCCILLAKLPPYVFFIVSQTCSRSITNRPHYSLFFDHTKGIIHLV